jgi:hypothetical protein
MASKPESGLQRRIQTALRTAFPGAYVRKIHVSEFQSGGIPDLIACIRGRFFGIEVKTPGEKPTPLQQYELKAIEQAGGVAIVGSDPQQVIRIIKLHLDGDVD